MVDPRSLIARLEARLTGEPTDAALHFRLGLLYEHLGGHAGEARRAYLAHCVCAWGYRDALAAEQALRAEAGRPDAAPLAHLRLGELLAHLERRDEAARALRRGTWWETVASRHYRLHVVPGSTASNERAQLVEQRERAWTAIHACYELDETPGPPIRWFYYESPLHKDVLTGDGLPAHALPLQAEVHAVYGPHLRVDGPHEDVHILLRRLGCPSRLLIEGAAEYAGLGHAAHARCARRLEARAAVDLDALLDDEAFAAADLDDAYPLAASFVAFLIERGGLAAFRQLYATPPAETRAAFEPLYECDAATLAREWRAYVEHHAATETAPFEALR